MIDHISILVTNYHESLAFYSGALEPLGYQLVMELRKEVLPTLPVPRLAGLGPNRKPILWIRPADICSPTHIAFSAPSRQVVDEFYRAALRVGGTDNGEPGIRAHYHPDYYGAFVLDPDGYNIEAVCHLPQ